MKTLQQYFATQSVIDHIVRADATDLTATRFYIHPNADGETLTFSVVGNVLFPHQPENDWDVCLDFSQALVLLKAGFNLSRGAWTELGMVEYWLSFTDTHFEVAEHITKTTHPGTGNIEIGWNPSREDLFAKDYFVVLQPPLFPFR